MTEKPERAEKNTYLPPSVPLLPANIGGRDKDRSTTPKPKLALPVVQGGGLTLMVVGYEKPIEVEGDTIILGRYNPGGAVVSVDLSEYNAAEQGVSRQHARLKRRHSSFTIEDLDSTNGTWVNKTHLTPRKPFDLRNGDMIQLGQLAMYIHFEVDEAAEQVIRIKSLVSQGGNYRLTPYFLAQRVAPFLGALGGVQSVCNQILDRKPGTVEIISITNDAEMEVISVKLEGAYDALRWAQGELAGWRARYGEKMQRYQELSGKVTSTTRQLQKVTTGSLGAPSATSNEEIQRLRHDLRSAEDQLINDLLDSLSPGQSDSEREAHFDKVQTSVRILTASPLYLVD